MALCGKKCLKAVNIDEALRCERCLVYYHQECVDLQKQLCNSIVKWKTPNVIFRCQRCVDKADEMNKTMINAMTSEFKKLEARNNERFMNVLTKIENIEKTLNSSEKKVVDEIVKAVEDNNGTWSDVVGKKKKKTKTTDHVVVIKPKNKDQNRDETRKSLENAIDPIEFTVKGLSNAANNGVIIRCENTEDCDKLIDEATKKMGNAYEINKPEKRKPRFKILKVIQPDDDDETLIREIKSQNRIIDDESHKIEIIKREQVKVKGENIEDCFNIVVQASGETFKKVMSEGNGRLFVGWRNYKVVDNVYIRRCYKCYGFNHDAKDCKSKIACSSCSLPHMRKDCKNNEEKCINCVSTNKRLGTKLSENHNVWSKECSVYMRKLATSKRAISYID